MKLSIRNFRGIAKADIALAKIALVAGPNEAGKTSIAQALQALLTGETVPVKDLRKQDAAMLIHSGTGNGAISLETEKGSARIEYPRAKKETEGEPPSASAFAVGMASLLDLERKEFASALIEYLKATPTRTDFEKATGDLLDAGGMEKLWASIEGRGWDAAHLHAKDKGIEMKGAWREVTGENYGSSKAETWMPAEWESDLDGASEESLSAQVVQQEEIRDASIAHTAVSEDRIAQLREKAGKIQEHTDEVKKWSEAAEAAGDKVRESAGLLKILPSPEDDQVTVSCPHCGEPCCILTGKLIKPPIALASEENASRRAAREKAVQGQLMASEALQSATRRLHEQQALLGEAMASAGTLKATEAEPGGQGNDEAALERARRDLQLAENRIRAWRAKTRADRLHASILLNQALVAILAADGLRAAKLKDAIQEFNRNLEALAEVAGWPAVEITNGLTVLYRGTAWSLCSESGKFRSRVMIQIALADLDFSDAVVIDGADILDKQGRNGLMRLLLAAGRPSLVCMTITNPEDMPDLRGNAIGHSYWIQNSRTEEG